MIRLARSNDLKRLQDIEIAAGGMFRALGMDLIADDDPPAMSVLRSYASAGRAWVAVDDADQPVAYLLADVLEGDVHIEQVTVLPSHAGQGIGRGLIENLEEWARNSGARGLSLTTFREVPWNAPYYVRLGFIEVPEANWTDGIRRVVTAEIAQGLHAWPRLVMAKEALPEPPSQLPR